MKTKETKKTFKAETIKRLSPRSKCYSFSHSKGDMVKHELRVESLKARVQRLKAPVEIQKCEFEPNPRVTSSNSRVTTLNPRVQESLKTQWKLN